MTQNRPDDYLAPQEPAEPAAPGATLAPDAPARRGSRTRMGIAAAVGLALVGGGVAVADPLHWRDSTGKNAPADVLPADSIAYLAANLDPGLSQKVEMVRFASKFPAAKKNLNLSEQGDVKQQLFDALTKDHPCSSVNYDADIKPWLGDQVGIAVRNGSTDPLLVVQASDETKARAGMTKLGQCYDWKQVGTAYRNGYLVMAKTQQQADSAATDGASNPLSKRAEFVEDFGKVGTQGLVNFWGTKDALAVAQRVQQEQRAKTGGTSSMPSAAPLEQADIRSGAGTLRFTDGNPELKFVTKSNKTLPTSTTFTDIEGLPSDTTVAFGMADGSQLVDQNFDTFKKAVEQQGSSLAELERKSNLKLPEDLKTLLGSDFRVALGKLPSNTDDPKQLPLVATSKTDKAGLESLLARTQLAGKGITVTTAKDDLQVIGMNQEWGKHVTEVTNPLRDNDAFKAAFAQPEQAQGGLYVNLDAFKSYLEKNLDASQKENVEPLQALGITSHTEDANYGVGILRVTAK